LPFELILLLCVIICNKCNNPT